MTTKVRINSAEYTFRVEFTSEKDASSRNRCVIAHRVVKGDEVFEESAYTTREIAGQMASLMTQVEEYKSDYIRKLDEYKPDERDSNANSETKYAWGLQDNSIRESINTLNGFIDAIAYLVHLAAQLDESREYEKSSAHPSAVLKVMKDALMAYADILT